MDTSQLHVLKQEFHPAVDYGGNVNAVNDYLLLKKIVRMKNELMVITRDARQRRAIPALMHSYENRVNQMTTNQLQKEYEYLEKKLAKHSKKD